MQLDIQKMNPVVLSTHRWTTYPFKSTLRQRERQVYEYELEYFTRSDGGVIVNGTYIPFSAGDMNLRRPGEFVRGVGDYACLLLVLDLQGERKRPRQSLFGTSAYSQPLYHNALLDSVPSRVSMRNAQLAESLMLNVLGASVLSDDMQQFNTRMLVMQILQELFYSAKSRRNRAYPAIQQAYTYICANYREDLSVERLVERSELSRAYFHAQFLSDYGCTPGQLITRMRMDLAQSMLLDSRMDIGDIAVWCGYSDPSYFSRLFRRVTSYSPREWREKFAR